MSLKDQFKRLEQQFMALSRAHEDEKKAAPVKVHCRCVFDRIVDIDSKNERFDADVVIELCWFNEDLLRTLIDPDYSSKKEEGKSVQIQDTDLKNLIKNIEEFEYDSLKFWSPDLFIENAINIKEEIRYKFKIVEKNTNLFKTFKTNDERFLSPTLFVDNLTVLVTEVRRIRGVFYERLELYDFPIDMQEISVRISSNRDCSEVLLVEDESKINVVNMDKFCDGQQWELFEFSNTSTKEINDEFKQIKRSQIAFSAFVVRRFQFYFYNAYILILLITMLAFTTFAIGLTGPQNRATIVAILMLTSINFRWVITQRLPSVSYLTLLDKFTIGCIILLALLFSWDAIIGSLANNWYPEDKDHFKDLENYVVLFFGLGFFSFVLFVSGWFTKSLIAVRMFQARNMKEYAKNKSKKTAFVRATSG